MPIGWLEPPVDSEQSRPRSRQCNQTNVRPAHLGYAHGVDATTSAGRLESRYRYSIGVVYNTFPLPPVSEKDLERLTPYADAVLAARDNHPNATLADLYDPDAMPPDLRRAHSALDRAVDRLYRRARFASERERVEHLFALYEQLQGTAGSGSGGEAEEAEGEEAIACWIIGNPIAASIRGIFH